MLLLKHTDGFLKHPPLRHELSMPHERQEFNRFY